MQNGGHTMIHKNEFKEHHLEKFDDKAAETSNGKKPTSATYWLGGGLWNQLSHYFSSLHTVMTMMMRKLMIDIDDMMVIMTMTMITMKVMTMVVSVPMTMMTTTITMMATIITINLTMTMMTH